MSSRRWMKGREVHEVEFETLVQSRRSVRGFRNESVPRTVIEAIIESAKRAPSSMNTQPWHVHVLTGSPLEEVRRRNMDEMIGGATCAPTSCARSRKFRRTR
ncbi:nitroreductase family protein [Bradyrhizobium ottawaense]|nr:nitroreductase family protein [Bradyrhizobium ottawaense]